MMKRIAVLAAAVILAGCQQNLKNLESGDDVLANKVLVAGYSSEYKQQVVNDVVRTLRNGGFYVKVIGLGKLDKEEKNLYGAILIVDTVKAGVISSGARSYLEEDPGNPKVVLFVTSGSGGEQALSRKTVITVDAVASASRADESGQTADAIVALIEARF